MPNRDSTYVVAMAKNAVLERQAESAMQVARAQSEATGETAHVYTAARYATRTWRNERRVVIKAEVVRLGERAPRDNPRFVVTNLPRRRVSSTSGSTVLARHREPDQGVARWPTDRPHEHAAASVANQLRVLLTAAAYVLMQELRLRAAGTACTRTQVTWLRDRLLKLGVQVVRSVRGSFCICRGPRRSARHGSASPSHSAHVPDRPIRPAAPSSPPGRYGPSPGEAVDIPAHRARPSPHGWPRNPLAAPK